MTAPIRFQNAPTFYDARDQAELRQGIARALTLLSSAGSTTDTAALEARVLALEETIAAILIALDGAGIPVGSPVSLDFSQADNSGMLTLYSVGGL